jgi:hypothetical protein
VAGLYLSWYVEVGGGAAIVLVVAATFVVVAIGVRLTGRVGPSERRVLSHDAYTAVL